MSFWQESGDHFYPERAHFTQQPILGRDFAAHLTTSYPILARRDLGNSISSMLRPKGKQWFWLQSAYTEDDWASRKWLEYASQVQRRVMYDKSSQFARSTKEGDHDFATFGQCVLSVELNKLRNGLVYRCWHLRDVAWAENAEGKIGQVHRNWRPTLLTLKETFGENKLAPILKDRISKDPFQEVNVRHVMIESEAYATAPGGRKWPMPWVSVYIDKDNSHLIEEVPLASRYYIIPRWQTVSMSQYSYSPAVIAALPEGRLLQAMTLTLLNAGEKAADPPMTAQQGVIRSDIDLRAGGITWTDKEYDERMGRALSPIEFDRSGIQYGVHMQEASRQMIMEAFYLNKLRLPASEREMTATETSERVQEYIRQALPLFEPMEDDYNGQICEETFGLLMRNGAFGPKEDIPQPLQGADVQFHFMSPLIRAEGTEKGAILNNAAQLIAAAAQIDPSAVDLFDASAALRDAIYGIGAPTKWTKSPEMVAQIAAQRAQKQQMADTLNAAHGAGAAMEQVGQGAQALQQAQAAAAVGQTGRPAA
jgi:hypothetical protein